MHGRLIFLFFTAILVLCSFKEVMDPISCPIHPRKYNTYIEFSMKGEYVPKARIDATRMMLYELLYKFMRKNPETVKRLKPGKLILRFAGTKFDSLTENPDPYTNRQMRRMARLVHVRNIHAAREFMIHLYIRAGKGNSRSLDTMDIGSIKTWLRDKFSDSITEGGIYLGAFDSMRSLYLERATAYQSNEGEYPMVEQMTSFPGGESGLEEFFEDRYIVPEQFKENKHELETDFVLDIANTGKCSIDTSSYTAEAIKMSWPEGRKRFYETIATCIKRSPNWRPHKIAGKCVSSSVLMHLRVYYEEDD